MVWGTHVLASKWKSDSVELCSSFTFVWVPGTQRCFPAVQGSCRPQVVHRPHRAGCFPKELSSIQAECPALVTCILPGIQLEASGDTCRSHLPLGVFSDLCCVTNEPSCWPSLLPPCSFRLPSLFPGPKLYLPFLIPSPQPSPSPLSSNPGCYS